MTWKLGDPAECSVCGRITDDYLYLDSHPVIVCCNCIPTIDVKYFMAHGLYDVSPSGIEEMIWK